MHRQRDSSGAKAHTPAWGLRQYAGIILLSDGLVDPLVFF